MTHGLGASIVPAPAPPRGAGVVASTSAVAAAPTIPTAPAGGLEESATGTSAAGPVIPVDPARRATVAAGPGGVEVVARGLTLGYPARDGFVAVLEGVDLELAPGERLAVVGASGCGKSTLLHALAGLLEPARGSVRVRAAEYDAALGPGAGLVSAAIAAVASIRGAAFGPAPTPRAVTAAVSAPSAGLGTDHPRGRAAYMFQNDLLLPWKTVAANASFAAEVAERGGRWWRRRPRREDRRADREAVSARARALLLEFGLEDSLHLYPHQLSGGMRQRVALARTLALGRSLVLLDEPFGSLDALTRSDLRRWMARVMETHPATWVLVTHDVEEAVELADRVVVLGGRPAVIRGCVQVTAGGDVAAGGLRQAGGRPADRDREHAQRRAAAEVNDLLGEGRTR